MKTLPPLKPNNPSLKLTRYCSRSLQTAFKEYVNKRDQSPNFDKQKYRDNIFSVAKTEFKDALTYAESCAASYFFHIKDRDGIVRVYDTHLLEEHRKEYSDFSILRETSVFD